MTLCPWHGGECGCTEFPYRMNGLIPAKCEVGMPIEMAPVRSVSKEFMDRYRLYLVPCQRCKQRFEKPDRSVKLCQSCAGSAKR